MIRALLLLVALAGASRAEDPTPGASRAEAPWLPRIARTLQSAPGWKIDLRWTVKPAAGGLARPRTTDGVLKLAGDNRFRFESSSMSALSDGTTAWQYVPSTGQVLVQSLARLDPSQLPGTLLAQALTGSETASSKETLDGVETVRLALAVGKGALSRYSRATLWAAMSDLHPVRIVVADAQGTETVWDLVRWTRWKPAAKDFAWKAPAGSETVDLRD